MKKLFSLFIAVCMCLVLAIGVMAEDVGSSKTVTIEQCRNVVDQLNKEFPDAGFFIPHDSEAESIVLNCINQEYNGSLSDWTKATIEKYTQFQIEQTALNNRISQLLENDDIEPLSVREQIKQTVAFYGSKVYLNSRVFSATGTAGTFIYESIISCGVESSSSSSTYFKTDGAPSTILSSSKKVCSVIVSGYPIVNGVFSNFVSQQIPFSAG